MLHNWTYIMDNFVSWSLGAYFTTLGFLFWPIIFSSFTAYLYLKSQSLVMVSVVLLVIFAAFGNYMVHLDGWVSFSQIAVALIMSGLVIYFMTKFRR